MRETPRDSLSGVVASFPFVPEVPCPGDGGTLEERIQVGQAGEKLK